MVAAVAWQVPHPQHPAPFLPDTATLNTRHPHPQRPALLPSSPSALTLIHLVHSYSSSGILILNTRCTHHQHLAHSSSTLGPLNLPYYRSPHACPAVCPAPPWLIRCPTCTCGPPGPGTTATVLLTPGCPASGPGQRDHLCAAAAVCRETAGGRSRPTGVSGGRQGCGPGGAGVFGPRWVAICVITHMIW